MTATTALIAVCWLYFAFRRLLTYLQLFQQEEYDGPRFLRGVFGSLRVDRRATVLLLLIGAVGALLHPAQLIVYGAGSAALLALAFIEEDPRKSGKKKLVMTTRATRTMVGAMITAVAWAAVSALFIHTFWIWIVAVQLIPVLLVVANGALIPYENQVQQRFRREAHDKLLRLKPTTIGITGSFGKTSVKHILAHILETQASTLMTPGSVNTEMGIARVVREQLTPDHRFFVCEMGAYGIGSIARLTALAPPSLGVITAIGQAHYERFRTLDTVAKAKFELAEAAVKNSGKVIVAEGALEQPAAKAFAAGHRSSLVVVGPGEGCDVRIADFRQLETGVETDVVRNGQTYTLRAPLFGKHQGLNLALSFAAACELGVRPKDALIALTSARQTSHRLEVRPQPAGWVKIDDAYNSNPVGFESALQLLDLFRKDGGRRILITPGMVELGASHDSEHARIGKLAGSFADVLIAVMPDRIPTFVPAYKSANPAGVVLEVPGIGEALAWLNANVQPRDVVLLENDLPDVYEKKLKI